MFSKDQGLFGKGLNASKLTPTLVYDVVPACCKLDIVVIMTVRCMCVRPCVRPSEFVRTITSTRAQQVVNGQHSSVVN